MVRLGKIYSENINKCSPKFFPGFTLRGVHFPGFGGEEGNESQIGIFKLNVKRIESDEKKKKKKMDEKSVGKC